MLLCSGLCGSGIWAGPRENSLFFASQYLGFGSLTEKTQSWEWLSGLEWLNNKELINSGGIFTLIYGCLLAGFPARAISQNTYSDAFMGNMEAWYFHLVGQGFECKYLKRIMQKLYHLLVSFPLYYLGQFSHKFSPCSRGGAIDPTSPQESVNFQICLKPL